MIEQRMYQAADLPSARARLLLTASGPSRTRAFAALG